MRTYENKKSLRLAQDALPEMKARLALLDAAISSLQSYQDHDDVDIRDTVAAEFLRPRPFLVARRDDAPAEKAS